MSWMLIILVVTVFASYQAMNRPALKEQLLYHPYRVKAFNEWHRTVTHAFVHADFTHLALNGFVLFQFGARLEGLMQQTLGAAFFPLLYFGGIAFAAIPGMVRHHDNPNYRSLGASGAVSAVLISYILYFPTAELLLFFIVPLPAFIVGLLFFVYEHQMDKRSAGHIAHDAHLWGGLYGLLFTVVTSPQVVPALVAALNGYLGF
jgi:membrane associated rhomboid family serine protease